MASRPVGHTAVYIGTFITDTAIGFNQAGYDTVIQYDWSVNGDNDWHYTSDWDNYELSPMFDKIGEDTLFISEAFWLLYDEFYESFQAITDTETGEDGTQLRYIDFENHAVFMRARYIATADGETIISEWSEPQKVTEEENAGSILASVNPPVLSDLNVSGNEIFFCVTSDSTFRKAELMLRLLGEHGYLFEYEISSSEANITATLPYKEGLNTVNLGEVTLLGEGIITLSAKIYHENEPTGIEVLDVVPFPDKISVGSVPEVSSKYTSSEDVSLETEGKPLNNTQIGGIIILVIALCIVLAAIVSSVGKNRRRRSPW